MAQGVTNSGWYSHKFLTGIFLMEWCSVWLIKQSTLVLKDHLFTMPQTLCSILWGTICKFIVRCNYLYMIQSFNTYWNHYTPRFNEVERGVYWFHLVRLSVCGQNRVRYVSSTIFVGSISYLHILSSKFRRCVACNVCLNVWNFGEFLKFVTWTLSSFDLGSNMAQ